MTQSRLPRSKIFPRHQPLPQGFLICRRLKSHWQAVFFFRQPFLLMINIADYPYVHRNSFAFMGLVQLPHQGVSTSSPPVFMRRKAGSLANKRASPQCMHQPMQASSTMQGLVVDVTVNFSIQSVIELPLCIHAHKLGAICGDSKARRPLGLSMPHVDWSGPTEPTK